MANFVYYGTFDESMSILADFCAQGFRIITQAAPLDHPAAPAFDTVTDELVAIMKITPAYFLAGSFTGFPIQYNRLADGKYLVDVAAGGPLMQSMIARVKVVDGSPKLLQGYISYQKLYRNPETNELEGPSPELIAAYRKAVSTIKKKCKAVKEQGGKFIGPEALEKLNAGEARL